MRTAAPRSGSAGEARTLPQTPSGLPVLAFRPAVLHLGIGCRRQCKPDGIAQHIAAQIEQAGFSALSLADISTIELKKDEPLLGALSQHFGGVPIRIYPASELSCIAVPNPSEKAFEVTGCYGVAESAALASASGGPLLIEKQKGKLSEGNDFTFALS